jgi:hypothetical protein
MALGGEKGDSKSSDIFLLPCKSRKKVSFQGSLGLFVSELRV